jgi:hypothetical protein
MESYAIPGIRGVRSRHISVSIESWKYQLLILGLVFVTGLICLRVFGPYTGDSTRYLALARNLAAGNGFSASASSPYYPEIFRAPLYPLFLSILFRLKIGVTGAILAQLVLYSLAILVITRVSLQVTGNQLAAFLLGILLSMYAPCVRWACSITTESLCALLFCSACFFLVRYLRAPSYKIAGFLGLVVVALFYTRATYFFIAPLVVIFCLAKFHSKASLRFALVLSLVMFLPIGAWVARNAAVIPGGFHPFGVGTGMALYVKKLELIEPNYDARTRATIASENFQSFFTETDPVLVVKADRALTEEAMEVIRPRWAMYLLNMSWLVAVRQWAEVYDPSLPASIGWIPSVVSVSLVVCAYVGAYMMRKQLAGTLQLTIIALLIAAVHAIFATEARYTSPVRPVLYMLSVVTLARIIETSWRRLTQRTSASSAQIAHRSRPVDVASLPAIAPEEGRC